MKALRAMLLAALLSLMGAGVACGQNKENGYTYRIGTTGFGTLCYPASISFYKYEEEDPETPILQGFRAFTVSGMDGNYLILEEIPRVFEGEPNSVEPETPVIVYGEPGKTVTFVCGPPGKLGNPDVFVENDIPATSSNLLAGTTKGITIHGENLFIMQNHTNGSGLAFYPCTGKNGDGSDYEYTVAPFRCYLDLSQYPSATAGAKALGLIVPEEGELVLGIQSLEVRNGKHDRGQNGGQSHTATMSDGIYTLSGVRADNPKKGDVYVMVMNGQAVKVIIK